MPALAGPPVAVAIFDEWRARPALPCNFSSRCQAPPGNPASRGALRALPRMIATADPLQFVEKWRQSPSMSVPRPEPGNENLKQRR